MKLKTYSAFGILEAALSVAFLVPETSVEFNTLAKAAPGTDPCNDCAVDYNVFHGCLADFRYYFAEEFQKAVTAEFPDHPALKRKTKVKAATKKSEETEVYDEAELQYVRRALAELAALRGVDKVEISEYQHIADAVMAMNETNDEGVELLYTEAGELTTDTELGKPRKLVVFDPTQRERAERGPKTLPKVYKTAAESIYAAGKVESFCTKNQFVLTIPDDIKDDEAKVKDYTIEKVGWKIKSLEDAERAKVNLAGKYA